MPDFQIGIKIDNAQALAATRAVNAQLSRIHLDAEAAAVAEEQAVSRSVATQRRALESLAQGHTVVRKTVKETGEAHEELGSKGSGGFLKIGAAVGVATLAMHKLLEVAQGVARAIDDAARKQQELASKFVTERDKLRELAGIQGKDLDNEFTINFAKFQAKTGLRSDEALKFQTAFANAGQQFVGTKVTDAQAALIQEKTGALAAARGIDPGIVGDLAGTLIGFKDRRGLGTEGGARDVLTETFRTLQGIGRGKGDNAVVIKAVTSLLNQNLSEDPAKGLFTDPAQLVAIASTIAESKPDEVEPLTRAALRVTRGFTDKSIAPLLKKAGVTSAVKPVEALQRIGAVVEQEAKEKGIPVQDVIAQYIPDERERVAIATTTNKGIGPGGTIADRLAFQAAITPLGAEETIRSFQETEVGAQRLTEGEGQVALAERGAETSKLFTLRAQATNRLIQKKILDSSDQNIKTFLHDTATFGLLGDAKQNLIDEEVQQLLNERAPLGAPRFGVGAGLPRTEEERVSAFNRVIGGIEDRGINPLASDQGNGPLADPEVKGLLRKVTAPPPLPPPARPLDGAPQRP